MVGLVGPAAKENQKVGSTVILAAKIKRLVKRLVSPAVDKRAKKEQNILPVDQHLVHAEKKARVRSGAKRSENYQITT